MVSWVDFGTVDPYWGCCIRKWHCRSLLDHCGRAWQTCYRLLSKLITNDYNYFQRLTITIKSIFPGFIRLQLQLICKSNRIINRLVLLLSTVYVVVQYDTVEPYLVVAVGYGSVDPSQTRFVEFGTVHPYWGRCGVIRHCRSLLGTLR